MKSINKFLCTIGVLGALALLSGCNESANVIKFEPGVYKGASDPLLGSTDTAALAERFEGQRDR